MFQNMISVADSLSYSYFSPYLPQILLLWCSAENIFPFDLRAEKGPKACDGRWMALTRKRLTRFKDCQEREGQPRPGRKAQDIVVNDRNATPSDHRIGSTVEEYSI